MGKPFFTTDAPSWPFKFVSKRVGQQFLVEFSHSLFHDLFTECVAIAYYASFPEPGIESTEENHTLSLIQIWELSKDYS